MSASATATPIYKAIHFYEATNGKKAVMAATGVMLFGYVVGHLAGNLQVFAGPERINRYVDVPEAAVAGSPPPANAVIRNGPAWVT